MKFMECYCYLDYKDNSMELILLMVLDGKGVEITCYIVVLFLCLIVKCHLKKVSLF